MFRLLSRHYTLYIVFKIQTYHIFYRHFSENVCKTEQYKEFKKQSAMSTPTPAVEINTAAVIAGGLGAFIGFLCIASVIIFIIRKMQEKINSHGSNEEKQRCIALNVIKERIFRCARKNANDEETGFDKYEAKPTEERKEHATQDLKVISSTPCFTKQTRINAITEDAVEILKKFQSWKPQGAPRPQSDVCIDVTYANGVILSPIVKYHKGETEPESIETFEIEDTVNSRNTTQAEKTGATTDAETGIDDYSNADIADVLDYDTLGTSYSNVDTRTTTEVSIESNVHVEEASTDIATLLSETELTVNGTLTLNLDYSDADIVSALDKIEADEPTKESIETTDTDSSTFPDQTYVDMADETTESSFSECDTALGLSRTFSFMSYLHKSKSYMAHSISFPDLTRSDLFLSDVSSTSLNYD